MRALVRAVFGVLLLATLASAQRRAETEVEAAGRVLAAFAAKDEAALQTLAARETPDPWLVVDELCLRGEFDAAAAFATAAPRGRIARLPAYVATQRERPYDAAAKEALANGDRALQAGDAAAALSAVEAIPVASGSLCAIRTGFVRGFALRALRRSHDSEAAFLETAEAAQTIGWVERATRAFHEASFCAYRRAEYQRAEELLGRELEVVRAAEDRRGVAYALSSIGLVHIDMGDYDKAEATLLEALRLARECGDAGARGTTLNRLGILNRRRGRLREALPFYEEAVQLAEQVGHEAGIAAALGNVGVVLENLGEMDEALAAHRRALEKWERIGDQDSIALTLGNIGIVHKNRGDYDEALQLQLRALDIYRTTGDRAGVLRTLGRLGVVHKRLGDLSAALRIQQEVLRLSREYRHEPGVLAALVNLAVLHKNLAEYERALEALEEALVLVRTVGTPPDEVSLLANRGLVRQSMGDHSRALRDLEQALALGRKLEDARVVTNCLANLGGAYQIVGDRERALRCLSEALERGEAQGDRAQVAGTLLNIGWLRAAGDEFDLALETFGKALAIHEELGDKVGIAECAGYLGTAHARRGDHEAALAWHEKALALAAATGARQMELQQLVGLGNDCHRLGRRDDARAYHARGLEQAEEFGAQELVARSLEGLAGVAFAEGRHEEATGLCRRAVDELNLLATGLAEEHGAFVRGQYHSVFEVGARCGLERGDASELCHFLEAGRAGVLLQSLGGRDSLRAAALPAALLEEEAAARGAESAALWRYRRALAAGQRAQVRDRRAELDQARDRVRVAIERIQREAKLQADLLYPRPLPLEGIRALLRPGEALVAYALYAKVALALVATRDGARAVKLGAPDAIEAALREASDQRMDSTEGVETLRRLVVVPLALPAETKRLLVSPDGALSYAPFALLAPELEVAFVPSATTYGTLLQDAGLRGEGVLALGDPDYGMTRNDATVTVLRAGASLGPLPGTLAEVDAIGDVRLLGAQANVDALREAVASRPRWRAVHLACHGEVDPENPARAWLALAADETRDGELSCLEVYRMEIPADLVVLSACETAQGKVYRAEGVMGFTRAFMFAGAPRVLVSLWKVDDEATRALMVRFYGLWNPRDGSKGLPAATALKRAQAFVASHERWKHPSFWAAWQLWGLAD